MRKPTAKTAIIWSIGLLFLTGFLFLGFFHAQWNLGILFFVVAFLGWGLQRLFGRNGSPPYPAVRFLRGVITAIVSGLVFLFGAIFVLMCLGTERHGNYEYYGNYPALYLIPGLVGLCFPSILAWVIRKVKSQKET